MDRYDWIMCVLITIMLIAAGVALFAQVAILFGNIEHRERVVRYEQVCIAKGGHTVVTTKDGMPWIACYDSANNVIDIQVK